MTSTTREKIDELRRRLGEASDVASAIRVLEWDMEVMMPKKGAEARGQHLSTLSAIHHRLSTAPEVGALLGSLAGDSSLRGDDADLVREAAIDYRRATCLPEDFVRESTEAQSRGYHAWTEARKNNDFAAFRPHLEKNVELARRAADHYGYEGSPYNALLDNYERGMTAEKLRAIFGPLALRQGDLVRRIVASPRQPRTDWMAGAWPKAAQEEFGKRVLADMGYDFDAGRQDLAPHPFCTHFALNDVRLTTRFYEDQPFSALQSSMHECGHALYDLGFDPAVDRTPLADAPSLGMHECNSRMWENMIGRSRSFWRRYLPVMRAHFPGRLDHVGVEDVYAAVNQVAPSLIRVEADECTYNLHVIVRFELECALVEGTLAVRDLPGAWNAKYKEYLGVDVPSDADGCLQDVHWSGGAFGYFPTYTLGNLYAAQIFETILAEIPAFWDRVEGGELLHLREWLRTNIHLVGRRRTAPQIVEAITGKPPASDAYLRYLESKYGELYGV